MLGLFENIGLAIEGAFVKARCDVANHIVDVKLHHKLKKYEKARRESGEELEAEEESEELEEYDTPANNGGISIGMMTKNFTSTAMPKTELEKDNDEMGEDL